MALTLCPATNCDSFVSLLDAAKYISDYTIYGDQWLALADIDQERYLRIAYELIINNATVPSPVPDCLPRAQALIAANDMFYGISASPESLTGPTKREKVGSLEVEYFEPKAKKRRPLVPSIAKPCMEICGWYISNNMQVHLGRG